MKNTEIRPNTFLIGAQKSATTSVYDWISQHPQVCGPIAVKDFPYFINKESYEQKKANIFIKAYLDENILDEKIILQGSVQYMFYPNAIKKIYNFNPESKLIAVLRNPVERAVSAYKFMKKMGVETLTFNEAIEIEPERLGSDDYNTVSDLSYVSHGLYGQQLKQILKYFDRKKIMILLFEEVKSKPKSIISQIYKFLEIDPNFQPELNILNKTGSVRSIWIQNIVFRQNKFRSYITSLLDPVFPLHKRAKLRWLINDWNTASGDKKTRDEFFREKEILKQKFIEDICLLEKVSGLDLSGWK